MEASKPPWVSKGLESRAGAASGRRPVTYPAPWGNSGPPSGVLPVMFRDTSGGVRVYPGRGAVAGRGMITVMESSNKNKNKNNNNNNNQNNNNKNNNTEMDDGVDLRNPSPARSDISLRSAGRLNSQKAKSDKGLVRQAPYETKIPRLVLSKIEEVSLNISLIKGKNSIDAIADTERENDHLSKREECEWGWDHY